MRSSGRSKWKSETRTASSLEATTGVSSCRAGGTADTGKLSLLISSTHVVHRNCHLDGVVERCLYPRLKVRLASWHAVRETYEDPGKGLRNQKSIPGSQLPGAHRMRIEGADPRSFDEACQLSRPGLGDHVRATWTVGRERAAMAGLVRVGHPSQTGGAAARAGATDRFEAKKLNGAGDQFAVEALRDEDGDIFVAEAMRAGEQGAMPEGIDRWAGVGIARDGLIGAFRKDVPVTKRRSERADQQRSHPRDDGEEYSLLEVEPLHEDECNCARMDGVADVMLTRGEA